MARLNKLKSGKWLVEVRKKGYPYVSKSFIDIKDARKFARTLESEIDRNVFQDYTNASNTLLKELLIKYREEKTLIKKGAKSETCKINLLIRHSISLNTLMSLRSHHIYKLMKELSQTRKPSTVNKYIHLIKHTWRTAKREWGINLPTENPCDMVVMNKVNDARDRILSKEEYSKLISVAETSNLPMLKDMIIFAYLTGCRQGEMLRLKRDDVDFNNKLCTFKDTKNGLDRTVPLHESALTILKKYPFGSNIFNVVDRRLRKHFSIATKKAKIENFRWHDLRACFATNALLSGMSIAEVSSVTGHKDWSQLKRYTRIKPQDLIQKINNIVRLK